MTDLTTRPDTTISALPEPVRNRVRSLDFADLSILAGSLLLLVSGVSHLITMIP